MCSVYRESQSFFEVGNRTQISNVICSIIFNTNSHLKQEKLILLNIQIYNEIDLL